MKLTLTISGSTGSGQPLWAKVFKEAFEATEDPTLKEIRENLSFEIYEDLPSSDNGTTINQIRLY